MITEEDIKETAWFNISKKEHGEKKISFETNDSNSLIVRVEGKNLIAIDKLLRDLDSRKYGQVSVSYTGSEMEMIFY